jgi:hypothetical protein
MTRRFVVRFRILGLLAMLPAALAAQGTMPMKMDHDQMAMPMPLTQHAKDQIAEAKRVAAELDTPEKARAAGYRPRFGDVPLQGEHWSNPGLVLAGTFDIEHPPTLMFATVNGAPKLVGVAYTYEVKSDAPVPDGFDGAAMWHEHPALSLPGKKLVMTHVWFVDSPNGVFAHDNPVLAFMERGLTYPPDGWLDAATLRKLSLTLQLATSANPGASRAITGPRNDSIVAVLQAERATVNAMVPQLEAARTAGNKAAYKAVAVKIGGNADELIGTIKQVPSDSVSRAFLSKLMDEALSENHGHE